LRFWISAVCLLIIAGNVRLVKIRSQRSGGDNTSEDRSFKGSHSVATVNHMLELPPLLQNAFERVKANAELEYAKRGDKFPHNPPFAESGLNLPVLMHSVFFEFCEKARQALKSGQWTLAKFRKATESAWPAIFDFYLSCERGSCSEKQKSTYRNIVWRTVGIRSIFLPIC
jgi:hypothetical protein